MNTQIRTNKTTSVKSSNNNNVMNIDLESTSCTLPHNRFFDKIDLYSIFEKERSESDNYRLIITINPLLTNVLFNMNTEIIKGEGGKDVTLVNGNIPVKNGIDEETGEVIKIYGEKNPNRLKMIQNTEYSKKGLDYQYHCGFDMFNNHLLRNISFKSVNMPKTDGDTDFNTIRDFMRYDNGDNIMINRRVNLDTAPELNIKKHLYDYEDILNIEDSINTNLIEENGWFGFTNGMKINTRIIGNVYNGSIYREKMNINKVMNNLNSCEFIDMYPDRSLFSFIPKVNKIQKRLEYNWKYCLTFPYKSTKNHSLVYGNNVNGLKCQYIIKMTGYNGGDVFLFRMLLPHNLKMNDKIILYNGTERLDSPLTVGDIGDLDKKNKKYMFYVSGTEIQESLGLTGTTYDDVEVLNKAMNQSNSFRINKLVGDFESEYYVRIFKKIPNFRYAKEIPTDDNIDEMLKDLPTTFDSDLYQLSFATNIFNEKSAQITFSDDINLMVLKDNLNRPISEIFLTVVKNNKGWKNWYRDVTQKSISSIIDNTKVYQNGQLYSDNSENLEQIDKLSNTLQASFNNTRNNESILEIEYSHCFGVVTSGFKILEHLSLPEKGSQYAAMDIMESDVTLLHNIDSYKNQSSRYLEYDITIDGAENSTVTDEINDHNDLFLGDVVEFNKIDAKETVLDSVYHRFNTNQREHSFGDSFSSFNWDELISDDYDPDGFKVVTTATTMDEASNLRPEGYYYKPHYKIPVRELSAQIFQESMLKIVPTKTEPYNNNTLLITTNSKHHLIEGENVHIVLIDADGNDEKYYICNILSVVNDIKFVLNYTSSGLSYGTLVSGLVNGNIELRKFNNNIPSYAFPLKDGSGRYVWRTVNKIGNVSNTVLKEENYPFTNNAFYYHKDINFFLRRQDPHNTKELYNDSKFPNDIIGSTTPDNKYDFVNEEDIVC